MCLLIGCMACDVTHNNIVFILPDHWESKLLMGNQQGDRLFKVLSEGPGNEDKVPCQRSLLPLPSDSNREPHGWESVVLSTEPRQLLYNQPYRSWPCVVIMVKMEHLRMIRSRNEIEIPVLYLFFDNLDYYCHRMSTHYVTVIVFKSWNLNLVSPHIHRTEICRILPSVRRGLCNMVEGDGAASCLLSQSPVRVIIIPLINMLKTVNDCSPSSLENHSIPWETFWVVARPGKKNPPTESGNGQRGSNVMHRLKF